MTEIPSGLVMLETLGKCIQDARPKVKESDSVQVRTALVPGGSWTQARELRF